MIRIKPNPENQFVCPKCTRASFVKKILVQPTFTLAECVCENCRFEFDQTLPVGHTITDTLTIDKSTGKLYPDPVTPSWHTEALLKAFRGEKKEKVQISKIVFSIHKRVIVLNTLDFLYGHVLLKLYNSIHHLDNHRDLGLVVIVPKSFGWLIPRGCAEVWIVDLNLSELAYFHSSIQQFVLKEFERFDAVFLSESHSHPEFTAIDISRFTGVKPFDLTSFLRQKPIFTFVLREDRWWWRASSDYWFYRVCRKIGILNFRNRVLSDRQNGLVKETIISIKRKLPKSIFYVVGLGAARGLEGYALDERKNRINDSIEKDWCRIYARSQVVIGVHGSNMLLPTAHAAGCIEILPEDRFGNIVQDISVRYPDRKQLYFYRFADQYSHPGMVADKAVSMIKNFAAFEKNMCLNVHPRQGVPGTGTRSRDDIYAVH